MERPKTRLSICEITKSPVHHVYCIHCYVCVCVSDSSDVVVNGGADGVAEGGGKLFTTVDRGEESPTTSESGESETHLAGTENGSCDRAQLGTETGLEMVEFPEEEKRQKKPRRKPPVLTVSLGNVNFDTKSSLCC